MTHIPKNAGNVDSDTERKTHRIKVTQKARNCVQRAPYTRTEKELNISCCLDFIQEGLFNTADLCCKLGVQMPMFNC